MGLEAAAGRGRLVAGRRAGVGGLPGGREGPEAGWRLWAQTAASACCAEPWAPGLRMAPLRRPARQLLEHRHRALQLAREVGERRRGDVEVGAAPHALELLRGVRRGAG